MDKFYSPVIFIFKLVKNVGIKYKNRNYGEISSSKHDTNRHYHEVEDRAGTKRWKLFA